MQGEDQRLGADWQGLGNGAAMGLSAERGLRLWHGVCELLRLRVWYHLENAVIQAACRRHALVNRLWLICKETISWTWQPWAAWSYRERSRLGRVPRRREWVIGNFYIAPAVPSLP